MHTSNTAKQHHARSLHTWGWATHLEAGDCIHSLGNQVAMLIDLSSLVVQTQQMLARLAWSRHCLGGHCSRPDCGCERSCSLPCNQVQQVHTKSMFLYCLDFKTVLDKLCWPEHKELANEKLGQLSGRQLSSQLQLMLLRLMTMPFTELSI